MLWGRVDGLDAASATLTKELKKVGQQDSKKFVTLALKSVEAATSPYVPVDTSLLINSAYTVLRQTTAMGGWSGEFGYGASYAGYVHDGGPKNWKKGGASDKFLEKGVNDFINETLDSLLAAFGE